MLFPFCVLIPAIREFAFFWHHGWNSEQIEHRTSNIERPTSNDVFCQFKKKTEQHAVPALHERIYPLKLVCLRKILRFACFKNDKAQRHQYWTFDVGRSMFDVQSVHFSLSKASSKFKVRRSPSARSILGDQPVLLDKAVLSAVQSGWLISRILPGVNMGE